MLYAFLLGYLPSIFCDFGEKPIDFYLQDSFSVVSRNRFEYTFRGEKRGPEDFTDFGKALRASYLFSVLA